VDADADPYCRDAPADHRRGRFRLAMAPATDRVDHRPASPRTPRYKCLTVPAVSTGTVGTSAAIGAKGPGPRKLPRRSTWISGYINSPAGAPLLELERVNVWLKPTELIPRVFRRWATSRQCPGPCLLNTWGSKTVRPSGCRRSLGSAPPVRQRHRSGVVGCGLVDDVRCPAHRRQPSGGGRELPRPPQRRPSFGATSPSRTGGWGLALKAA
jgi:hypothetical protein